MPTRQHFARILLAESSAKGWAFDSADPQRNAHPPNLKARKLSPRGWAFDPAKHQPREPQAGKLPNWVGISYFRAVAVCVAIIIDHGPRHTLSTTKKKSPRRKHKCRRFPRAVICNHSRLLIFTPLGMSGFLKVSGAVFWTTANNCETLGDRINSARALRNQTTETVIPSVNVKKSTENAPMRPVRSLR